MKAEVCFAYALLGVAGVAGSDVKPLQIPGDGKVSDKVRESIRAYLRGDLPSAVSANDDASINDLNSSIPWLNGSLFNLELGRIGQARQANAEAIRLGDQTVRARSISVEIETARGQLSLARRRQHLTEFMKPEDPYVHEARAKLASAMGDLRTAERSRWQAMRFGRQPLLDSRLDSKLALDGGPGAAGQGSVRLQGRQVGKSIAAKFKVEGVTEVVASGAEQKLLRAEGVAQTGIGQWMLSHRSLAADRPGLTFAIPGLPVAPNSRLKLSYTNAGWQKRSGNFTFNASYREADSTIKPNVSSPSTRDNFQTQWMGEARFDQGPWTFGAGLSQVHRDSSLSPAIEPLEEVFGSGRTRLAHGYAVHRKNVGRNIRLISGVVGERIGGANHVLVSGELAIRTIGQEFLRIGVKPTMNRVGTNIFPEDLRGLRIVENPIDSAFGSTQDFNQSPYLMQSTGKLTSFYSLIPLLSQTGANSSLSLFSNQFTKALFAGGNTQLANSLLLTPLNSGSVTGVTSATSLSLAPKVQATVSVTAQKSSASYRNSTASIGPVPSSSMRRQVPNVANLLATTTLDFEIGTASVAFSANYVGERLTAFSTPAGAARGETFQTKAPAVTSFDFSITAPLSNGHLRFSALNLTKMSFYAGSPGNRQFLLSYGVRF